MNLTDPTLILTAGGFVCLGLGGLYVALSRSRKPTGFYDGEEWTRDEILRAKSAAMQDAEYPARGPVAYVKDGKVHVVTGDGLKMHLTPVGRAAIEKYGFPGTPPAGFGPGPEAFDPDGGPDRDLIATLPRYVVPDRKGRGFSNWRIWERDANGILHPIRPHYTRRSSALRAARRLNAKEAGR